MKKFLLGSVILAIVIFITPSSYTSAKSVIQVNIDNNLVHFNHPPVIYRDFTMVPMRELFSMLGAEVQWDQGNQIITASIQPNTTVEMKIGSTTAKINHIKTPIDVAPLLINGRTFVPLRFISESLGAKVSWDSKTNTVNIVSSQDKVRPFQATSETLSIDDVLKRAIEHSESLKKAEQDVKRMEINKGLLGDNAEWKIIYSADLALEMARRQVEIAKDQVMFSVKEGYRSIYLTEIELKNKIEICEIAKLEEQIALGQALLGRISENEKNKIIAVREQAENELYRAEVAYQDAMTRISILMGKQKGHSYILAEKPTYSETNIKIDMNEHTEKMVALDASLWRIGKQVELAQKELDSASYRSYELAKMDLESTTSAWTEGKRRFEDFLRKQYESVKTLEQEHLKSKAALLAAEEDLVKVKTRYEKGIASLLEVKKEELKVNQLKRSLAVGLSKIDQVYHLLYKPWLV
ncbi:stalk domain-containing protein [Ammoniphilus sp. YIM 78166]|uniref:stalk domain-containing protein n=1 Tax=Ammoniphilus sp. YIM 78166 TaxID=1644106 RepID=UPI0010705AE8|nr:stalk domain-containing protein [Ammoniphilus sp. YIM 78166]